MSKRHIVVKKPAKRRVRKKRKGPMTSRGSAAPRSFHGRLLSEVRKAWRACPVTHANLLQALRHAPDRPLVIRLKTRLGNGEVYVVYEMLPEGQDFRFKRREDLDVSVG